VVFSRIQWMGGFKITELQVTSPGFATCLCTSLESRCGSKRSRCRWTTICNGRNIWVSNNRLQHISNRCLVVTVSEYFIRKIYLCANCIDTRHERRAADRHVCQHSVKTCHVLVRWDQQLADRVRLGRVRGWRSQPDSLGCLQHTRSSAITKWPHDALLICSVEFSKTQSVTSLSQRHGVSTKHARQSRMSIKTVATPMGTQAVCRYCWP